MAKLQEIYHIEAKEVSLTTWTPVCGYPSWEISTRDPSMGVLHGCISLLNFTRSVDSNLNFCTDCKNHPMLPLYELAATELE